MATPGTTPRTWSSEGRPLPFSQYPAFVEGANPGSTPGVRIRKLEVSTEFLSGFGVLNLGLLRMPSFLARIPLGPSHDTVAVRLFVTPMHNFHGLLHRTSLSGAITSRIGGGKSGDSNAQFKFTAVLMDRFTSRHKTPMLVASKHPVDTIMSFPPNLLVFDLVVTTYPDWSRSECVVSATELGSGSTASLSGTSLRLGGGKLGFNSRRPSSPLLLTVFASVLLASVVLSCLTQNRETQEVQTRFEARVVAISGQYLGCGAAQHGLSLYMTRVVRPVRRQTRVRFSASEYHPFEASSCRDVGEFLAVDYSTGFIHTLNQVNTLDVVQRRTASLSATSFRLGGGKSGLSRLLSSSLEVTSIELASKPNIGAMSGSPGIILLVVVVGTISIQRPKSGVAQFSTASPSVAVQNLNGGKPGFEYGSDTVCKRNAQAQKRKPSQKCSQPIGTSKTSQAQQTLFEVLVSVLQKDPMALLGNSPPWLSGTQIPFEDALVQVKSRMSFEVSLPA
ncbi:hypothetical protein C8R46DRAFT_1048219 [Mycena filopes]|nr:hypothetical protein C8R46DRAFT_1048219 [Mycena filopes]